MSFILPDTFAPKKIPLEEMHTAENFFSIIKNHLNLLSDPILLYSYHNERGKFIENGDTLICDQKNDSSYELHVYYDCNPAGKIMVKCEIACDIIPGSRKNFNVIHFKKGEECEVTIDKKDYKIIGPLPRMSVPFVSFNLNHRYYN